jgi:hypothetical protein
MGPLSAISGIMDTFQGRSTTACKNWLKAIQHSAAKCQYASFVDAEVAEQFDGESVTGTV